MPGAISADDMFMPGAISMDKMSTPCPTPFNEDNEMVMVNDLSHSTQGNDNVCSDEDEMAVEKDLFVLDAAGQHTRDEAQTPQPSKSQVSLRSQK